MIPAARILQLFILLFILTSNTYAFLFFENTNPYYGDDIKKSMEYYEKEIEKDRNNIENYYDLASVYKEFGENRKAFDVYRDIVFYSDKELRPHFELAKMYYFLGAYNYAEEEISQVADKNSTSWEVYFWWGNILLEKGEYDDALAKYAEAAKYDDRKNIIYLKIAETYEKKRDLNNAIENYKQAFDRDKTYVEIYKKLAMLYEKEKKSVMAFKYWALMGDIDTKNKTFAIKLENYAMMYPAIRGKISKYKKEKEKDREAYIPPDRESVTGSENLKEIKVGLLQDVKEIYFKCGSEFSIYDSNNKEIFKGEGLKEYVIGSDKKSAFIGESVGDKITNKIFFKGGIYIIKKSDNATTNIYNVRYGEGFFFSESTDTTYRGDFLVKYSKDGLALINLINVEEYLYGVVPAEIISSWPPDALRAQAVAARTYTFKHLNQQAKEGFDLSSQQVAQVYKGLAKEDPRTNAAIDDTRGEVLYCDGTILNTFYHDNSGGHTEDVNEIWGLKKIKALSGVYDGEEDSKWNFPLSPFWLEEWVRSLPDVYCKVTGKGEVSFRWIRYLTAEDLEYFVNREYEIGKIKNIMPVKRAKGGSITKLYIEGDKGSQIVKFDKIRSILGKLRGNVIKWEYRKDSQGYIKDIYIYGAGWGHGVGMCQQGTYGMALKGKKYTEILYHYFPGSEIRKLY